MTEAFPLSPQQKRLWFLQQDQAEFRARLEIMIEGTLDVELLRRAIDQIVERHEILRTTFQRQPGIRTAVQVITDAAECSYSVESLADDKHLLKVSLPSMCCDAATLKCFYDDLCRGYGKEVHTEAMQYADFAAWQNELLESEVAGTGSEFWQQRTRTPLAPLHDDFEPARRPLAHVERLDQIFDRSTFLQACWQALMWRLTAKPEFIMGSVFDGRNYDELDGAFGLIAKCVPVPVRLDHDPAFADQLHDLARELKETERWLEFWTWETTPNQYIPLCFEYQRRGGTYDAGDVRFRVHDQFVNFDRYNLKLVGFEYENDPNLYSEIHYDPRVVSVDAVRCIADQLQQLIASALENPQARLSKLRLLSDNERQRLVVDVNDTARVYATDVLFHTLFEQQTARTPANDAVRCEEQQLTYAELNARANQLAHYLRKLGVGPEVPVVLNLERSVEVLIGILAILKAGGAYVPLEGVQPRQRLTAILDETSAPVIVTQSSLREQFNDCEANVICIDSDWDQISTESNDNPGVDVCGENIAYVIYTSGSTGKPKGVAIEHRQLANYLHAIRDELDLIDQAGYAIVSTFAADLGNTMIFPALCTGGVVHLVTKQQATDAGLLIDLFTRHRIDYLKIVPSHLEALLAHEGARALLPRRLLVLGGEAAGPGLLDLVSSCVVYNHYGPTETTVGVLTHKVDSNHVSLGRPLANNTVYVLDQQMNPMAVGETGEIYLGGAQVSRGYVNQAAATAERFIPDPFSAQGGARLYRTGDLGRFLPNGNVEFAGRADNQIKLHGHRIELSEIRYALNQHSAIRDSVAVIKDDQLVAHYIAPQQLDVSELRSFLAEYLGPHAIPNHFNRLAKFPLTPNGKLDLQALAQIKTAERSVIAPATPMEELLAGLWTNLLGLKQVSTDDDFFAVGGHSLLATRIVSQLHKLLHVEVPFTVLFEAPTIAETARRLELLVKEVHAPPIERVSREQKLPLSYAQQRLWFVDQLNPNSSSYNNPSALRLTGCLNVNALEQTVNEIIRRHEILRTSFRVVDGEPVQIIVPAKNASLPLIDLSQRDPVERESEMWRVIKAESGRPFDLAHGPLLRVTLLRLGAEAHVLVITMHHIVTDAWSNEIFMREASALYRAFLHNEPSPLPELPVQYADYANWQRRYLAGETLETLLAYWRQRLSGPPPMLELADHPRTESRTARGAKQTVNFPGELLQDLKAFSRQRGVTLFMTLVASFKVLLHFYTKQDDVVIGTDVANRNRTEVESLIGFFVNQLVLRTNLSGDPTFGELLERVREVALAAYAHQDLPFDRLVEVLKPERDLKYAPFFQIKLVLENTAPGAFELPGVEIEALETDSEAAKLDLILVLRERAEGLQGWFEYDCDLIDASTVTRLAEYLEVILRGALGDPNKRISELQETLTALESEHRSREQQQYEDTWRENFKKTKPQPVPLTQS